MIVAILNNKGGVAKTTTAVNLAAALTLGFNKKCLVVDLDDQANASEHLGVRPKDKGPAFMDILRNKKSAGDVIRKTTTDGLDLIATNERMMSVVFDLKESSDSVKVLRDILAPIRGQYDFIFLDCPPGRSLTTINAAVAADRYLTPLTLDYLSGSGTAKILQFIKAVPPGHRPQFLGALLCKVDRRNRSAGDDIEGFRSALKDKLFETQIPINVKLAEACGTGSHVFDYAPSSSGARAFRSLAAEFIGRVAK